MTVQELAKEIEKHNIFLWQPEYAEYGRTTLYLIDENDKIIKIPYLQDYSRYGKHLK